MHKAYHLGEQLIPAGFQIYRDRVDVAGLSFRKDAARAFCTGRNQWLSLRADTSNAHDKNAIKIIGHWRGLLFRRERMIGFVPAYYAAMLSDLNLVRVVRPRLLKTFIGRDGYVEVMFQIIGPIDEYQRFKKHLA